MSNILRCLFTLSLITSVAFSESPSYTATFLKDGGCTFRVFAMSPSGRYALVRYEDYGLGSCAEVNQFAIWDRREKTFKHRPATRKPLRLSIGWRRSVKRNRRPPFKP